MLDDVMKGKVAHRLNRIEGQVAGVRRMVESDAYCIDVLNQISAAQAALGRVGSIVLQNHLETCVAGVFESGNDRDRHRKLEEIMEIFHKYGRLRSR
jgi:DNA-binding FrmR family transcriptional regulator